jgi:cyclase
MHIKLTSHAIRIGAAIVSLAAVATGAPAQDTLPSILTYRTIRLAEGVYAFITPEERSGFQAGNSVAIIGEDAVLVFDTGNIPSSTRRQIAEIRKLTAKPVRYVVNSHWHPDHNLGNAEYRAAFPSVTIIGTSATRRGILEQVPGYFGYIKAFATSDSLIRQRLVTGRMRDSSAMPPGTRLAYTIISHDYAEFRPDVLTAHPLASDLVFDDSLTISLGRRDVKIVRPGRGNTDGDAFAYVPDARVLLTGDLITVPCPFPSTAFFTDWIAGIDQLTARNAETIVPGHGDVQHDYRYTQMVRDLLVYTRDAARDAVRSGKSLEQLQKAITFDDWLKRFAGDDPLRAESFRNFYAAPALERAFEEAKFLSQGPVSPGLDG